MVLRTSAGPLSHNVSCVSLSLRGVTRPRGPLTSLEPGDTRSCLSCVETWTHWLHPANWVDTQWPAARYVE